MDGGDYGDSSGYGNDNGDGGNYGSSNTDYSNNMTYSIDQREDNQSNWNQGPFTSTPSDENDKTTFPVVEGILGLGEDITENEQGMTIYPALGDDSFVKEPLPNENGETPQSLLLDDVRHHEEATDGVSEGCGPVDCLYYSLVCCTII